MSVRNSYTTADYLEWDTAMALVRKLYNDKDYRFSLLIGCGCFFGLRISDLRAISWDMILDQESFMLNEKKTGKRRIIRINRRFQKHIQECYNAMKITNRQQPCFISNKGGVYSIQRINAHFKEIRVKYGLKIKNFSTHTMRKTWARQIWEMENAAGRGDLAILKLQELMNHSSPSVSRRYIHLRQEELGEVYDALDF